MNTNLNIRVTKNYGKIVYYPNCTISHHFATLLNQSVLTIHDLATIKKIGFTFQFSGEALPDKDASWLNGLI